MEQHFWQQDSKEEIIVTEIQKVETIEEVFEVNSQKQVIYRPNSDAYMKQ